MNRNESEPFKRENRKPDFKKAVPRYAHCSDVLKAYKDFIIKEFEKEARRKIPASFHKDSSIIIDSLPQFLDVIISALAAGAKVEEAFQVSKVAEAHGKQRADTAQYTLEQTLFEYSIFRRILLSVLREHTEVTEEESDVIHEAIEEGMLQAASEFTRFHQQAAENFQKEKRRLAESAERSGATLKALLASAPVGIAFLDQNLNFIEVNHTLAQLVGVSSEKYAGRNLRDLNFQDADIIEPLLSQVLATGKPLLNVEYILKPSENRSREVHTLSNYFPVKSPSGGFVGLGVVVVNITDLSKIKEALRKSEELQRRIFESSEDCYKILDLEGNILVLTEQSRKILEIEKSDSVIGKSWLGYWTRQGDLLAAKEALQNAAAGGKGHFVGYYPTPSGKRKWWDVVITPMRDQNGKPEQLLATSRDVTALHEVEDRLKAAQDRIDFALRESYQSFKEMTDSLPVLFWWTDEGGKGNHYNNKFYEYTGLPVTSDPELKENFYPVIHPEDLPNNLKIREEALRLKKTARFEERVRRWDGEYRWHLVQATPVFDANGNFKRWYATSMDIHEQKIVEIEKTRTTESLKTQTEKLNTRNAELDRFAAIAAHDLKAPLNSITQFAELLADQWHGRLGRETDEYIDFIVNAGNRMRDLIDNLLEFSRSGAIDKSKFVPIDTMEAVNTARKNLLAEFTRTDARIIFRNRLPIVLGNKLQITQLFQNLMANAIKFHKPHQPPKIEIDFTDAGDSWRFSIEDQGIGMDPQHSGKIFEIFNKLHGPGQYEGSGIGLAVCKRIVEVHGGKIDFQSEPGQGTTFFFTLPKAASSGVA